MEQIHRYKIQRQLGEGAMGTVWLAEDPNIERLVAIKTIRVDAFTGRDHGGQARERFLKEAKIAGRLQHPHVVTVYDVGEDSGVLYLAMEFIDGESLSTLMAEGQRFPLAETLAIVAQAARALGHAHARGVVHRDIKPGNIMIARAGGDVKVTDFGISKLLSGASTELTATGQILGSPSYMSPEQVRGEAVDQRTDIFSLGIVFYQLVTGSKPFPSESITTLVYQILNVSPRPAIEITPGLPAEINRIIQKAIEKDPAKRYPSAEALARDIEAILATGTVGSSQHDATKFLSVLPVGKDLETTRGLTPTRILDPRQGGAPLLDPRQGGAPLLDPRQGGAPLPVPVSLPITRDLPPGKSSFDAQAITVLPVVPAASPAPHGGLNKALVLVALAGFAIALALLGVILVRMKNDSRTTDSAAGTVSAGGASVTDPSGSTPATGPGESAQPNDWRFQIEESPLPPLPQGGSPPPATTVSPGSVAPARADLPDLRSPVPVPAPPEAPAERAAPPLPADYVYATRGGADFDLSPDSAQLIVDGHAIGSADDWDGSGGGRIYRFAGPGHHYVRVRERGYREVSMRFDVGPNAPEDVVGVDISLQEIKGADDSGVLQTSHKVKFDVDPEEAQVYVNGQPIGTAEQWSRGYPLSEPGTYTIRITLPGYQAYTTKVTMTPQADDDEVEVQVDLVDLR